MRCFGPGFWNTSACSKRSRATIPTSGSISTISGTRRRRPFKFRRPREPADRIRVTMGQMAAIAMALLLALAGAPKAPAKKALLKIDVKPAAAVIYVDGKRKGTGATVQTLTLNPGPHTI